MELERTEAEKKERAEKIKADQLKEKEQRREQRQREKQEAIAAEIRLENEKRQQEERERISRKNAEQRRMEALSGSNFVIDDHDWSTGAPYVYECEPVSAITSEQDWVQQLQNRINARAEHGWEFFRSEDFTHVKPAGCLASLFGSSETTYLIKILVFRKPAIMVKREREVRASVP